MGEPKAMVAIANLHESGVGFRKDDERALEYFQQAADLKDPYGLYKVGRFYLEGRVYERDIEKAIEFFTRAAREGSREAQRELGIMHEKGLGGFKMDIEKAVELFEQAAEKGDAIATNLLGSHHFNRTKKFEVAAKCFKKAAGKCPAAANNMGMCFEMGVGGVEQDLDQACALYK